MPNHDTVRIAGRYRLDAVVGEGSSAEVWSAWDEVLQRTVAIKLLGVQSEEEKQRIWREARLAALLGESVAIPIYDFGDDGDTCFLVMELALAPNLRTLLENGMPASLAPELGLHLARALVETHRLSIVHRDIKPENVFVEGDTKHLSRVRLVDFGLAFKRSEQTNSLGRLTDTSVLSGTPLYLSPEQARGGDIDAKSDIYSTGCVLYEVASGTPPFSGTLGELLSKHMYIPAIPLRERVPDVAPEFAVLVDDMLRKAPEERPSAEALAAALVAMGAGEAGSGARFEERVKQSTRSDRMVPASGHAPGAPSPLRLAIDGEAPTWLIEKLADAGIAIAQGGEEADMQLAALDSTGEDSTGEDSAGEGTDNRPRVVWASSSQALKLPELIARGIHFAITPKTPSSSLLRSLQRSARKGPRR